jgi:hypothetical protein
MSLGTAKIMIFGGITPNFSKVLFTKFPFIGIFRVENQPPIKKLSTGISPSKTYPVLCVVKGVL